jgi:signal transduction histidine kinase/ligand-binding sensor domain-containing protein/DNA-binding response OmpR family regulator
MKCFINKITFILLIVLNAQIVFPQTKLRFDIYTQEEGLPNNQIQCIYQDSKGWMWIGTSQGLSRFDGYNFLNFLSDPTDSSSLKGNLIRVIKEDKKGNLLIGTENGGLNIFNREKEIFTHPFENYPDFRYQEVSVNDIIEDGMGNLWLATDFNIIIIDSLGNLINLDPEIKDAVTKMEGNFVRNLKFDLHGQLWIGTNNGVYIYHPLSNKLESFNLPFKENQNREIWELFLDDEGLIWIGTYSAGLFIIDPVLKSIKKIELDSTVARTETVRAISKGFFGEYWIGTRGGLFKYTKTMGVTGFYRNNLQEPKSLSNNSVWSIFNDSKGETWIGTRGGLNLLAKSKQVFQNFTALPGDKEYLNSSIVYAFWIDNKGKIWIGTEDGGINIYNPVTKTYEYITADRNNPNSISQNCIKAFLYDRKGNLWVGTFLGGINVIDLKTRKINHLLHNINVKGSLSDNQVWDICFDKDNQIWIATSKGIDRYDEANNSFIHYPQLNGNEKISWIEPDSKGNLWMGSADEVIIFDPEQNSINRYNEHSRGMYEDTRNRIWIATNESGIALYSDLSGPLKYYSEEDGLANKQALCILEDNDNNLWISTSDGLSKFDPAREIFQNFTSKDGLGNNQFCYGAAYKTERGELLFGTISGFNMFNPDEITAMNTDVPLVFTDLKIFNKSVPIGSGKKDVLQKSISETDHLVLNYKQNVFTLEFAALNYVNNENNLFSYKLEGFNRDWIGPSKDRFAPFTNLNPGDYTLRVKRVFNGNKEESKELQLNITILPPLWKTSWFIALIITLIILMAYILIRFFINREKIKNQLVIERVNARKLHELDMMKLKFFTNISHEIRTPLTLILGPLEKMLSSVPSKTELQENLKLMQRNAQNLDRLITQLLDFRKLQSGNLKLNLTEADIVCFIRNIVDSFNNYAIEKDIKLTFTTLKKRLFVSFDPDKIEKILNNLLSNAFKFTGPKGSISVNLSLIFDSDDKDFSDEENEQQFIEISIKDTGKGIPSKNIEKIFMRFFQSEQSDKNSGAGIGLALVKELVNLHNGNIFVTSKPGKGTKFTIRIPYNIGQEVQEESKEISLPQNVESVFENADDELVGNYHLRVMLIIEDNADVRQFIRSHFNTFYRIYEASDGEKGWKIALETIPDIIISDIIMPNMDGYELCKRIKNDERTSHIPVLLLTAIHSKEHELKGLTTGADDYITKPFDLYVLQAKVENLLSIRDSLKEKYTSTIILEPANVVITSPDERFLKKAIDTVEANISDFELDIESFAQKVGVSRMQLYRKLHALTNMTVKEFIRHIRLKRATQLLVQQKMNISEIAYEVGFKDLSHFRKCFKREFGMSATDFIAKQVEK